MDFHEYQARCRDTAQYPQNTQVDGLTYTIMGLGGEVGEIQNKFKKVLRGDHGEYIRSLPYNIVDELKGELGDVLWYVAEVATQLDCSMEDIAKGNIAKLSLRKANGKIQGSGDNR